MPKTEPFQTHADRYGARSEQHAAAYESELQAVRELWQPGTEGLEIKVGAGHFAEPTGIKMAVEPVGGCFRGHRDCWEPGVWGVK